MARIFEETVEAEGYNEPWSSHALPPKLFDARRWLMPFPEAPLDLGSYICIYAPDDRPALFDPNLRLPTDYFLEKSKLAKGVAIKGPFLFNVFLFSGSKRFGPVIRKICKYHDRFGTWPHKSVLWLIVLENSRWTRWLIPLVYWRR